MNATLSLPPKENLDMVMLKVARDVAMDIYPISDILKNNDIDVNEFMRWQNHPQFQKYLQSEKEAWSAASNTAERTKLKAGIVMEMFMDDSLHELKNPKTPLNQRVELAKVVAKLAGFGQTGAGGAVTNGSGFRLQINIGAGHEGYQPQQITISSHAERVEAIDGFEDYPEDAYDPFSSPNSLED